MHYGIMHYVAWWSLRTAWANPATPTLTWRNRRDGGLPVFGAKGERDAAYHQGTVWAWLIGPLVSAHLTGYVVFWKGVDVRLV